MKLLFRSTAEKFEVWKGNTLDQKSERKFDSNPVTEKAKKRGNNIYCGRKKKKNRRGSVRKEAEGSRINDFIMPLKNIKMRKITVRGGRGDKCVRERV